MPVNTMNLDGVSIDEQLSARYADVAEAHLLRHALDGLPASVLQL